MMNPQIDVARVTAVYTGRPGCACGCRGKYRYASAHASKAGQRRGYAVSADEISDRSVKLVTSRVNKMIAKGLFFEKGEGFVAVELPSRLYIVKF